ncbi:MAG: DsrE family protein [Gemmatimonadetes bacterium]|jgi:intracellular sulfur oxidation DsrE/DsrF family protein|nr:DsrE family protein [Gemmatimonadota bacterium]MCC6774174.1 DsrE family protein [Gemmatimonadaceae bacterium]
MTTRLFVAARRSALALGASVALLPASALAQRPDPVGMTRSGPVIQSAGPTVKVDDPTFMIPAGHDFKSVFEINVGDTATVNQQLVTVARFLNVHVRHGIPKDRVHAAAVIHGSGWMAILSDSAYGARFAGKANPSRPLVEELLANGVQLVLCGQTAGMRGVDRRELLPGVKLGISAMTALNVFQAQGYQFNPW